MRNSTRFPNFFVDMLIKYRNKLITEVKDDIIIKGYIFVYTQIQFILNCQSKLYNLTYPNKYSFLIGRDRVRK